MNKKHSQFHHCDIWSIGVDASPLLKKQVRKFLAVYNDSVFTKQLEMSKIRPSSQTNQMIKDSPKEKKTLTKPAAPALYSSLVQVSPNAW